MKSRGFSEAVIQRLDKVHADSTNKSYLSQWKLFEAWCADNNIDPLRATSVAICDFFVYLFKERNLKVRTIEGYKSAIGFVLKRASEYDLAQCTIVSDLIKGFKRERPAAVRTEVKWDIAAVLSYLRSRALDPGFVSVRALTFKAVFLVALALGKRRSEIHALTRESVVFAEDMSSVSVKPHSKFLSKTHFTAKGLGVLQSVSIPALPAGDSNAESLCPVRTLERYITISDAFRAKTQSRLFIPHERDKDRDMSPQTLSHYVRQVIIDAYKALEGLSEKELLERYEIKAHQVRHVAHSLGQIGAMPLSDIVKTGLWSSPNTFINSYLQDVSDEQARKLSDVGSFVAIETVFSQK